MNKNNVFGFISNIFSLIFVGPFSLYFSVLGFMFLCSIDPAWSIAKIISLFSGILFLITPILCFVGIVLSVIFRKRGRYKDSYLIQLLPFFSVILGVFMLVLVMVF